MKRFSRAQYLAPTLHALLFVTAWCVYALSSQPMMDGLAAVPFFLLFITDIPISIVAFFVLFTSATCGSLAVVLWGVVGTLWWVLLGRSIDRRLAGIRNKRRNAANLAETTPGSQSSFAASSPTSSSREGTWGIWIVGSFAVLAVALVVFAWAQTAFEKADNGGAISDVTFSPDGQFILLSRSQANSEFLYKVAISSGTATRLTSTSSGFESFPSYSQDGKRIVFSYTPQHGGHSRIFVMDANGAKPQPLFQSGENNDDLFPRFAANGKICFARSAFFGHYSPIAPPSLHEWDLYEADPDGQNVRPLTNQRFYDISPPSLSSDGKELLFSVETQAGSQMQMYSLDSNAPMSVLKPHVPRQPRTPIYANAVLTPDGRSIIFLAASEGAKGFDYDVYRLDLATNVVEKLTTSNGYSTNLCLSSDGRVAAFLRWSSRFGSTFPTVSRMYLLDLTTKSLTPLPITGSR
jgi:dipeptidyl aminopeptidase/acylaminoacyl peptidase